jgi:hypothetical protein
MLEWDRYGFHKKRARTHYTELVFFQLIGSVGDILHSTASVAQNVDALFLMLEWDWYRFYNKARRDTLW